MPVTSSDLLKHAVESQHGGTATFLQRVPVRDECDSQRVCDGTVAVFDLRGQPDGHFRAYAWSHEPEGGKRRFYAVLHGGTILSPADAVRWTIVAEQRAQ